MAKQAPQVRSIANPEPAPAQNIITVVAEIDAAESVRHGPLRLDVAAAWVVRKVLGHGRVRVEPDLRQPMLAGPSLGEGEQARSDAVALHRREHGDVLQQQVPGLDDEHDQASSAGGRLLVAVLARARASARQPDFAAGDGRGVVGGNGAGARPIRGT